MAECSQQVIFLRGWVYGMSTKELKSCYQELVKELRKGNYKLVIWDGDLDKPDSFTSLISRLMLDKEFPDLLYLAFKHSQWIQDLKPGYTENDHGVEAKGYQITDSQFLFAKDLDKRLDWVRVTSKGINLPNKKLTVMGFYLGEGKLVDWSGLSRMGIEFAINQLKITHFTMMTIGEGPMTISELNELSNRKLVRLKLIRLKTQRLVGDKIETSPLVDT